MASMLDEHPSAWDVGKPLDSASDQDTTLSEGNSACDSLPRASLAEPVEHARLLLKCLHTSIFLLMWVSTSIYLMIHKVMSRVIAGSRALPVLERPRKRLTSDMFDSTRDLAGTVAKALPTPPPFPESQLPPDGLVITFGPCANLMIYLGGVCYCLQRMPNYKEVAPRLRFYGVSCGAIMAAMMAADVDMSDQIASMWAWTDKFQDRLWGLVGAYSSSVAPIIKNIFADPRRFESARSRLSVGVTAFTPAPKHIIVGDFESPKELTSAVLGSCYIPIAFEDPQWS